MATSEIRNTVEFLPDYSGFDTYQSAPAARRPGQTTEKLFVLTDFLLLWLAAALALILRFSGVVSRWKALGVNGEAHIGVHAVLLLLYSGLVVLLCHTQRLYQRLQVMKAWREDWATVRAVGSSTVLLSSLIFTLHAVQISRIAVGITAILSTSLLVCCRHIRRSWISSRVASGYDCRNVLIVGAGKVGFALKRHLDENRQFGYLVKGFLDRRLPDATTPQSKIHPVAEDHVLGAVEDLSKIARTHFIDEVLITVPNERDLVKRVAAEARSCGLAVRVIPDLYDGLAWGAPIEYLGLFPTMSLHYKSIRELELLLKRTIDIAISALGLVLCAPLLLLAAIAICLDNPGPLIYRSLRVGKKGKAFHCLKLRTMVMNAEEMRDSLQHLNERKGLLFKISNDPRITRVGRWLRKYSIDEIPQFWNVLKGEMSLVGPRPPLATEFEKYDPGCFQRLDALPGITGLWQVEARQDSSFESYINLDLHYVEHWNLALDLRLLIKTLGVVVAGTGR